MVKETQCSILKAENKKLKRKGDYIDLTDFNLLKAGLLMVAIFLFYN